MSLSPTPTFRFGDLVWAPVESSPPSRWPAHVFHPSLASHRARSRHDAAAGRLLVSFFGDDTYNWVDPADLLPFEPHYPNLSKQKGADAAFKAAVEEAVDEVRRRAAAGATCRCKNLGEISPVAAKEKEGLVDVRVAGDQWGRVYSEEQIAAARAGYRPEDVLGFVRVVAVAASDVAEEMCRRRPEVDLEWVRAEETAAAVRRYLYEEVDEPFYQAIGKEIPKTRDHLIVIVESSDEQEDEDGLVEGISTGNIVMQKDKGPSATDSEIRDSLEIIEQKKVDKNGRKATKKKFLLDLYDKSLMASKETCVDQALVKKGKEPKSSTTHGEVRERNLKKKNKDLNSRVDHEGRLKKSLEAIGVESGNDVQAKSSVDSRLKRKQVPISITLSEVDIKPSTNENENGKAEEGGERKTPFPAILDLSKSVVKPGAIGNDSNNREKSKKKRADKDLQKPTAKSSPPLKLKFLMRENEELSGRKIKKQKINPQGSQQQEQLGNKTIEDSAVCIARSQPVTPTSLSLKFPPASRLPSVAELKAVLARFGSIYPDQTRVNWNTSSCTVVFKHKTGAEAADQAIKNKDLFAQLKVASAVKQIPLKEEPAMRKSCLKKPAAGGEGSSAGRIAKRATFSGCCAPVQAQVQDDGVEKFKTQMLDLLRRCNEIVNTVKASSGYRPYSAI